MSMRRQGHPVEELSQLLVANTVGSLNITGSTDVTLGCFLGNHLVHSVSASQVSKPIPREVTSKLEHEYLLRGPSSPSFLRHI